VAKEAASQSQWYIEHRSMSLDIALTQQGSLMESPMNSDPNMEAKKQTLPAACMGLDPGW
jgi:hypothetical protein